MYRAKLLAIALLASAAFVSPVRAQTGAWTSHPVMAAEGCDNLQYVEVADFLQTHYYPSLTYGSSQDESGQQMLTNYGIAGTLVARSQACLADALELKELSDELREQTALLKSGTSMSKRQLKKQRALTAEANAEIEAAAARLEELTPEQRERFGKGSAAYLAGAYATSQLFRSIDEYLVETRKDVGQSSKPKSRFGGLPGIGKVTDSVGGVVSAFGKASDAGRIFAGLKDHVANLYETSQFLAAYSREKEIELPADATNQLAEFSDWA
jgi:hypothetical protein